jgi:predicted  nucleic acid-binding Zn-ribbon protein
MIMMILLSRKFEALQIDIIENEGKIRRLKDSLSSLEGERSELCSQIDELKIQLQSCQVSHYRIQPIDTLLIVILWIRIH